jgi:hypothetical protein
MFCWVGLIFFFCVFCVHDKQPPRNVKAILGWLTAGLVLVMSGAASGAVLSAVFGVYKVWVHGS